MEGELGWRSGAAHSRHSYKFVMLFDFLKCVLVLVSHPDGNWEQPKDHFGG